MQQWKDGMNLAIIDKKGGNASVGRGVKWVDNDSQG